MSASTPLLIELLLLVLNCVVLPAYCAHWLGPSETAHWATNRTWSTSGPLVLDPFLRAELAAPSPAHQQQHAHQNLYEYSSTPNESHAESSGSSGGQQVLRTRRAPDSGGVHSSDDDSPMTLHIAGFLGRSRGALHAVHLALHAVNARRDILGPYRLAFLETITMCDIGNATKKFFDMMHEPPFKLLLFCCACPDITPNMADISRYWNIWQISYADTNTELSERSKYPYFVRVVPSDKDFNPARDKLLVHFNWTRVAALVQYQTAKAWPDYPSNARYTHALNSLSKLLEAKGKNVSAKTFVDDAAIVNEIRFFREQDYRVIFGLFDQYMAVKVFCAAFREGFFGERRVWIVNADWPEGWWTQVGPFSLHTGNLSESCTADQILSAAQGFFTTSVPTITDRHAEAAAATAANATGGNDSATIPIHEPSEYLARYNESFTADRQESASEEDPYHAYAYDAIWTIALMLRGLGAHNGSTRQELEIAARSQRVGQALERLDFTGVTGRVSIHDGDRKGLIEYKQLQRTPDGTSWRLVRVGMYDAHEGTASINDSRIEWRGADRRRVPGDRSKRLETLAEVSAPLYVCMCAIAALGMLAACTLICVNLRFRNHRFIKMSSPNMNNLILVGSTLIYSSVVLFGADRTKLGLARRDSLSLICLARPWVLSIGFTLAFGAMFSKTWRVHAIFTNIKMQKKVIKDSQLIAMVAVLLLVDVLLLLSWTLFARRDVDKIDLPQLTSDDGNHRVEMKAEVCKSEHQHIWMGILYAIKTSLLVVGLFFAWETRRVSLPALNDSKYIGASIYVVVTASATAGAATWALEEHQADYRFLVFAAAVMGANSVALGLVFVPKLIELRRDPRGKERRVRATFIKGTKNKAQADTESRLKRVHDENTLYKKLLEQKNTELDELEALWKQEQERRAKEESAAAEAEVTDADVVHLKVPNLRNSLHKMSGGVAPPKSFPPPPNIDIQSRTLDEDADTPREPPPPPPIEEEMEGSDSHTDSQSSKEVSKDTPPSPSAHVAAAAEDRDTPKHAPPPIPNEAIEGTGADKCEATAAAPANGESGGKSANDAIAVLNLVDSFMDDSPRSDEKDEVIWVRRSAFSSREPLTVERNPAAASAGGNSGAPERPLSYTNERVSQHADSESPERWLSRPGTQSFEDADAEADGALLVPAAPLARDMSSLSNPWQRLSEQSFAVHTAPVAATITTSAAACASGDGSPLSAATSWSGTRDGELRLREKGRKEDIVNLGSRSPLCLSSDGDHLKVSFL